MTHFTTRETEKILGLILDQNICQLYAGSAKNQRETTVTSVTVQNVALETGIQLRRRDACTVQTGLTTCHPVALSPSASPPQHSTSARPQPEPFRSRPCGSDVLVMMCHAGYFLYTLKDPKRERRRLWDDT